MVTRIVLVALVGLLGCKREVVEPDVSAPPADPAPTECLDDSCAPPTCAIDDECPTKQICDGGQCVHFDSEAGESVCGIATLYFASESAKLTPNNQERLASAAPCLIELLKPGGELLLEAADDVDSMLADRRGSSVREFLIRVGVPGEQLRVEAKDVDASARASTRRVRLVHVPP